MSLFSGTPQQATSYVTSTSETPKWMQDAIYNQIQMAQNVANTPYQAYSMPTVAGLSPLQQQAYTQAQNMQGAYKPTLAAAQAGMQTLGGSNASSQAAQYGLTAQSNVLGVLNNRYLDATNTITPYAQQAAGMSGLANAQPYMTSAANRATAAGDVNTASTLSPYVQQMMSMNGMTSAQPYMDSAYSGMQAAGARDTASGLQSAQNEYLRKELVDKNLNAGQELWGRAGQLDSVGAAQPYMNQSASTTAEALSERAMQAANPYLQSAAQSSASGIGQYMNPYNDAVTSRIAELGGRNLSENLLPNVSDAFIRAGQFGGSRMGEFGSRALRDTQDSVLAQQAQALQQGYGQALGASQADLARQAQLAGTVGSISGADLSRVLQGAGQYGSLASTAGQLTGQQMQNLGSLGQMQTGAGQAQQQFGLESARAVQQAQAQDAARQLAAAQAQASLGQTAGGLAQAQQQAILSGGQASQQAQAQDAARSLQSSQQLSNIGQNLGNLTQAQQQALLASGQAISGAQAQMISQAQAGASQYGQMGVNAGNLASTDAARQLSAYGQLAGSAQQGQQMGLADIAALESAGTSQQQQAQAQMNAAYNQYQQQQLYPKQQLDWLSTQVRGMAPITPTSTSSTTTQQANTGLSPLSQLASGYSFYRGMNQ